MKKYDIIFAGWGASTCVLLIEMANQNLLENKSIVIIDPGSKVENDKTFCFWAQPSDCLYLDYASIISHEILWIVIPAANSRIDRLRMKGAFQFIFVNQKIVRFICLMFGQRIQHRTIEPFLAQKRLPLMDI